MSAGLATDSAGRARGNVPVAVPVPGGGGGGFVCGPYCGGVVGCVGVYGLLWDITGCASAGGCWFMVSGERGCIMDGLSPGFARGRLDNSSSCCEDEGSTHFFYSLLWIRVHGFLWRFLNTGWCPRGIPESGVVISC